MRRLGRYAALAAFLGTAPSVVQAQTLFTGSGCSGNTFLFCASWTGTYIDATHFSLFITNGSQNAPASNANSAITKIAIGNVTVADPGSMGAVIGWQYDASPSAFNGLGLLENEFGAITTNGILNSLLAGTSLTFSFTFLSSIGTYAQALTAFAGAQIALEDDGDPAGLSCDPSKGVLPGGTAGSNTGSVTCSLSVAPEPGSIVLVASGLIPILAFGLRRHVAA